MQQQQQKPKQLTLFQAGFKKDEVSRWGVPLASGPSRSTCPPPCQRQQPTPTPGPSSATNQDSDVILIDDDEEDLLLAQALDETMSECLNPVLPPAAAAGTPLEVLPGFDADAGTSWVYPVNYPVRQYQYNIVRTAIFENTLVSLPTGLGKTFIAAVLMYNFYRWYPRGKVVFLAPTRPLVAQQIDACYRIMGIPRQDTAELTGSMSPSNRRSCWLERRVFFLTPQVLNNDLTTGSCPADQLRCVVIDEAHKALGNHAYCQVIRELSRHTTQFRVLALSATPGSDIKAVIQVLTNLLISRVEVRSEECPDVTPYTHGRQLEKIVVPLGDGLKAIRDKYMEVVRTFVSRLIQLKVVYTRDETTLTKFALLRARDAFKQSPPPGIGGRQMGLVESDFAISMSLYHALELLQLHGVRSFHSFVQSILRGEKGSARGRAELVRHPVFNELMTELAEKFGLRSEGGSTGGGGDTEQVAPPAAAADLVQSHPKLARLRDLVEQHFRDCGDTTRVMVFSQYRESVLEISAVLQQMHPTVRAMHFIGQSTGRASRGFSQKEQLKVIAAFRSGGFNTLVSTCVGEEGLDIGDVDLIVCYDVSKSPISLVQRMGRTGRKRQGRIVVLVTEGKEASVYSQSMYQRKTILKTIMSGTKLAPHLFKNSPRMVPRGLTPVCHRLHMTVAPDSPVTTGRGRGKATSKAVAGRGRGRGKGGGRGGGGGRGVTGGTGGGGSTGGAGGVRGGGGGRLPSLLAALAPDRGPATAAYLEDDEMREWDARYKLRPEDGPARRLAPRHPAGSAESGVGRSTPTADPALISLHEWLPWQTTLQPTHLVSHSDVSRNLVSLLAFMAGQALTGSDAYDQEMKTVRRHGGWQEEPAPAASMAPPPPPPPARPASPPICPAAADVSILTESEQVAEAIRLSLLETSGPGSPPPPPPPEPDWPPVAPPPPPFAGWGGAAGLLAALEEALATQLVTDGEGALLLSAERGAGHDAVRLEARRWLEMELEAPQLVEVTAGASSVLTGPVRALEVEMTEGASNPKPGWKTDTTNGAPKPEPVCRADPLEGPSHQPLSRDGGGEFSQDWHAEWDWHMSPPPGSPPPVTPPSIHPANNPSAHGGSSPPRNPAPPTGPLPSNVPDPWRRDRSASPRRPPVVSLLSDEDGSPILPSQNPSKRRKLSRRGGKRKIELPARDAETVVKTEAAPEGASTNGASLWNGGLTVNQKTPAPPPRLPPLSPPPALTSTLQAGLTRRPSSEDLFADESLFARVEEPPAFVDEPAASLGFEPAAGLVTPGSTTPAAAAATGEAAAKSGAEASVERQQGWSELPFGDGDGHHRQNSAPCSASAKKAQLNHRESNNNVQRFEGPPQTAANHRQDRTHQIHHGEGGVNGVQRSGDTAHPAPSITQQPPTQRRRHPSSQPLFDFGFDDDALFANVVTPPQPREPEPQQLQPQQPQPKQPQPMEPQLPQPQHPTRPMQPQPSPRQPHTLSVGATTTKSAGSVPLPRQPADAVGAVSSALRSPPLLARSAVSVRGSPAAGTSIYSTTQLLELVDQSMASPAGGRTPARLLSSNRAIPRVGTPNGRPRNEQGRRQDRTRQERCDSLGRLSVVKEDTGGEAVTTVVAGRVGTQASQCGDRPKFDLFADFFEDSDLFEGMPSNPTDPADPVDSKGPKEPARPVAQANPVVLIDLTQTDPTKPSGVVQSAQQNSNTASRQLPVSATSRPPATPSADLVINSDIHGAAGTGPDSPLFTVTRPQPQTPSRDQAEAAAPAAGPAVRSPAVSPILSSQRRPREAVAVARRHSTPLSARGPRRLSRLNQRSSAPLVAPASTTAAAASSTAAAAASTCAVSVGDDDPWAEAAFQTPRRPAAQTPCMTNGSVRKASRVSESPLARPTPVAPNKESPLVISVSGEPDKDSPLIHSVSSANGTDNAPVQHTSPVVMWSRIPNPVSPLARPVSSRANDTDSPAGLPRCVANDTDSPIARPAGVRRRRPALLRDSEDESPPAGWLLGGAGGRGRAEERVEECRSRAESTGSPGLCRDSSSESVVRQPAVDRGKKRRRRHRNPFLDDEADLSDAGLASSDDEASGPDSDQYDQSMIDDAPNPTQADVDMRAVYLKSVRSPARAVPGFRRPARPRPTDSQLFSQVPHQDDDYEQDSFCVDSDHVEYASSASSHGGSPADRQRRRRRIVTLSSSDEHSPAPAAHRDASAATRSDTSAASRQPSGSESDADFQLDRSEANRRSVVRERTTTKSSDEKSKRNAAPADSGWLSSKRPAASLPRPSTKLKRRTDTNDPFESSFAGTSKTTHHKRPTPSRAPPVFDLGLFDSDEETSTAAPLTERKQNVLVDPAERARRDRLERARLQQAQFRKRLTGGGRSAAGAEATVGSGGARTTSSGRTTESSFQSRLSAAGAAANSLQAAPRRAPVQPSGPLTLVTSSREVSCAPQVLSDLRAVHRLSTEVRSLPAEDYVVSRRAAVVRRPAADLQTAAGRRKLTGRLQRVSRLYTHCWLVVERDRVRPGTAPPAGPDRRGRAADALLARLARAGVRVLHSDSAAQSASLLSRLAAAERQAGWCLPPPLEAPLSPQEEARRRLLEALPGVSVPLVGDIRSEFNTLAEFLQRSRRPPSGRTPSGRSSPSELERRLGGVTSHGRAVELCQALRWSFNPP